MVSKKTTFNLQQGSSIYHNGLHYVVVQIVNLEYVLAENVSTSEIDRLKIAEVTLTPPNGVIHQSNSIEIIEDQDWNIAQQRLEIIQPLVHKVGRKTDDVKAVASKYDLHINTLYSWLRAYEADNLLTCLMPKKRSDSGAKKLNESVETIINDSIENEYLSKQKKSIAALYRVISLRCNRDSLSVPHVNTIRNRVKKLSDELKIRKRFGANKAHSLLHMNKGEFPHANYPLSVIQIDHTLFDIILVDDEYRLPIGRPWVTMAIDVNSRMVTGMYTSFDPPGALGTGICIANSILPKDNYLVDMDIATSWPCWGMPRTVHADNAKEFRGRMLTKACEEYGITLEWRPVARPHFGGHIERLLGTFSLRIHDLPGTTFSNTKQREGYDSEKRSALTLKEFERWLSILIVEDYHQTFHSGIKMTPIQKYEMGILGSKTTKGVGLPRRVSDEETLRINFLPYVERTVQDYGIRIDDIYYYSDVLRVWVNSTVEGRSKLKRKFICRRDPRDISAIWFFDPQLKTYFTIPYRNISHPSMSIWELRSVQTELKKQGKVNINEDIIFDALEKMRAIESEAVEKTKKSRMAIQRRKSAKGKIKQTIPSKPTVNPEIEMPMGDDDDEILPFDEMVEVKYD